jgi:hypothetical protein
VGGGGGGFGQLKCEIWNKTSVVWLVTFHFISFTCIHEGVTLPNSSDESEDKEDGGGKVPIQSVVTALKYVISVPIKVLGALRHMTYFVFGQVIHHIGEGILLWSVGMLIIQDDETLHNIAYSYRTTCQ